MADAEVEKGKGLIKAERINVVTVDMWCLKWILALCVRFVTCGTMQSAKRYPMKHMVYCKEMKPCTGIARDVTRTCRGCCKPCLHFMRSRRNGKVLIFGN